MRRVQVSLVLCVFSRVIFGLKCRPTRTLSDRDGSPHVRVDEYMKHHLQNKLIQAILKDSP